MATTQNTYSGNGSNKLFSITFPYLDTPDIDVYLNGTLQTVTTQYSFANATTIEFVTAPANGATITLIRVTPDLSPEATFFPGSSIKASDLNDNFDQIFYIAQETVNRADTAVSTANLALPKAGGTMTGAIVLPADPSTNLQAATKQYVDAVGAGAAGLALLKTGGTMTGNLVFAAGQPTATTSTKGIVQLTDSVSSTSTTTAATPAAVKVAQDTADAAQTTGTNALPKSGGTMTGAIVMPVGSTLVPSLSFTSDVDTGIYSAGAGRFDIVSDGYTKLEISTTSTTFVNPSIHLINGTNFITFMPGASNYTIDNYDQSSGGWNRSHIRAYDHIFSTTTTGSSTFNRLTIANDGTVDIPGTLTKGGSNVVTVGDTGTVTSTMILNGTIVDGDINASAAIVDTKLATIATAGKVSNSATTATNVNTASAIVARDASGNFTAGTITAALTGAASSNVLKAGDTMTGPLVTPAGTGTANGIQVGTGTTYKPGIYSPGADQLAISTNGTGRLFVDASGKLGVNMTPASGTVVDILAANNTSLSPTLRVNSNNLAVNTSLAYDGLSGSGQVTIQAGASSALIFGANAGEKMRILSGGNVGIGTSSPGAKLEVVGSDAAPNGVGDFALSYASSKRLVFGDTGSPTFCSWIQATQALGGAFWPLALNPSGGNVGIGTTSPGYPLSVKTTTDGGQSIFDLNNEDAGNYGGLRVSLGNNDRECRLQATYGSSFFTFYTEGATGGPLERLRITSAGLVGIGTSAPNQQLELQGANAYTSRLRFSYGSSAPTYFADWGYSSDGNKVYLTITDNNIAKNVLVANYAGNVGIGTTGPGSPLHVKGSSATGGVRIESYDYSAIYGLISSRSQGGGVLNINAVQTIGDLSAEITFNRSTNGSTFSEAMRIDSGNRLLVGTSSASANNAQLQIVSSAEGVDVLRFGNNAAGTNINLYKTRGASNVHGLVSADDSLGQLTFRGSDGSSYIAGASIRAEVDGTPGANDMPGRLVFSTTADGASSPTERMRISQNGQVQVSNALDSFLILSTASAGTSNYLLAGNNNAATAIFIYSNGNVVNTNNSYGAISDIKLKENISDANSQWDDLKALQVRKYNFKEGQTHTQIGLIAQEAELVSPGLVSESPDRDDEGNDLGTVTKLVNYSVLYMKAVKALQEAMERIETLETRLTAAGIA